MAINTVGISVLPNHTHNPDTSNDGGALNEGSMLNTTRLRLLIWMQGKDSA